MSGSLDFDEELPLPDVPLQEDTGVGGMWEGFATDEALVFGFAGDDP